MSTRQLKPIKTSKTKITLSRQKPRFILSKPKPRFILSKPKPKITGFKISGHGEFVDIELLDEGFQEYKYNLKTFIVRVRGNFGESVLTRQCSTQIQNTCQGGVCTNGDDATYVNFLQIKCGRNENGHIGLFSALPYIDGNICNKFEEGNDINYNITSLIPDLELSKDDENYFYYGYLIYYNGDNGTTDKIRPIRSFNDSPTTHLSTEIKNFYKLVKDSNVDTFNVDVSACLVISDKLQNFCDYISKGFEGVKYKGWFSCFHNFTFTNNCRGSDSESSSDSSDSDTESSGGKGKKKKTIKKKVKKKKVKKKKLKKSKTKKKKEKKKPKKKKPKKKKP